MDCRRVGFPYAIKAGVLTHISAVARGIGCDCVCAACGQALIARKGFQRQHHFAHQVQTTCDGGLETMLHRLAKETFLHMSTFRIPEYRLNLSRKLPTGRTVQRRNRVVPERVVRIDHVATECRIGNIIPDVVITCGGRRLMIEITVTHPCDRAKLRVLRRSDLATLEIRLSDPDAWLTREQLREQLESGLQGKRWLFHPRQRKVEGEFFRDLRAATLELRQQRRDQQQQRERSLARARAKPLVPAISPFGSSEWREFERFSNNFERVHGHLPLLADTQAYCAKRQRK
jgi:hypothetical protein